MHVFWIWLRNSKNLAALTAIGGAVAYVIGIGIKLPSPEQPQRSHQPTIVVSPQIHIENKPSNIVNAPATSLLTSPVGSAAVDTQEPKKRSGAIRLPIRRTTGTGLPVDVIPGLSITVWSIAGSDGRFDVELASDVWGYARSFTVGDPPEQVTVRGKTYRLGVERVDGNLVTVVLADARP